MPRSLYQIIGCLPTANDHEIKRAYRRLSKRYHPDLNPHDPQAATKFIELQQAYELYRFFPGIGAALMFALIRMCSGNHSEIYKEPVVTYYSATPVGSNDPQNNHSNNNSEKFFAPPVPQALQQINAGEPVWLEGKVEHRFFNNPVAAGQKESVYLLHLSAPVLLQDTQFLAKPLLTNTLALILADSNAIQIQPLVGRTTILQASLELATTLHQHANVIAKDITLHQ